MNVDLEVRSREDVPRWIEWGTPVFTIISALLVGVVALLPLGVNPINTYWLMFVDPLTSIDSISSVLVRTVPLVLAGLAVYIPLKANLWNIGAEGQIYIGAIVGTAIALTVDAAMYVLLPLSLLGATLAGFVWGAIPGYLRAKFGTNEIIVTLMMTFVGIQLNEYVIQGPLQSPDQQFPVGERLPSAALLPTLFGDLHAGFLVAIVAVVAVYILMAKTKFGFEITFVGSNPLAARQAGISKFWVYFLVLAIGGALAGIAGQIEIAGNHSRLRSGFSPDYGFTAIPIALLGRNGPFRVLLAAMFFALLFVGGSSVQIIYNVPPALINIIQALIILFLITSNFFKDYKVDVKINDRKISRRKNTPESESEVS
jgi:simple sugar transport system permease protein